MAGQGSTGNVIAALCSFFIPGLGQLLQGRLLMAIFQFVLAAVLWFTQGNRPLAAAGVGGLIVVHYLAGLMVETFMSVRLAAMPGTGAPDRRVSATSRSES